MSMRSVAILLLAVFLTFASTGLPGGAVFSSAASAQEVFSLDECIDLALKNNPDVHLARENLKKYESSVKYSYGNLLPNLSAAVSSGHVYYGPSSVQFDSQGRPVQTSGFDYNNYGFRMTSDMVFFDGGGNYSRINNARHTRDGAREQFQYSKDLLTADVIRAYYNLVRSKMLYIVTEESMEQAGKNLSRSEALLEVGSATRADVLKAKVRYSNTRLSMISARNRIELAREELAALLNTRSDQLIDVDTTLIIDIVDPDPEEEITFAIEHRSDLKSLDCFKKAAKSGITRARSGWFPVIGANFGYYWNDRAMAENFNFFKEEYQWNITGYISLNIFDRFMTSTNIASAKADYRIAEYNLEKSRLSAVKEIKSLLFGIREASERIDVATETVEQATEDVRLAEERYRVGAGTMLETIDAQVALTQAKADVIEARCDYLVAVADLARATGRRTGIK
ncbi:MAG: TolC family protein [Candidatus Krumholzibacteriota bacterium]|nr:TolC family protein [Candidatus Krumholzibacteriota bacterium]